MKTPSIKTRRFPTASKVVALLLAAVILTPTALAIPSDWIYIGLGKDVTTYITANLNPKDIPQYPIDAYQDKEYSSVTFQFEDATIVAKENTTGTIHGIYARGTSIVIVGSLDVDGNVVGGDVNVIFKNLRYDGYGTIGATQYSSYFQTYALTGTIDVKGKTIATITDSELTQLNIGGYTQHQATTPGQSALLTLNGIDATITRSSIRHGLVVGTSQQSGTVHLNGITLNATAFTTEAYVSGASITGYQKKLGNDSYVTTQTAGAISLNLANSSVGTFVSLVTINAADPNANLLYTDDTANALMTVTSGEIALTSTTVGGDVYAAGYVGYVNLAANGVALNSTTLNVSGDIDLSLTNTTVNGYVSGGAYVYDRSFGTVTGDVSIDIIGTTDIQGGIYAAGYGTGSTVKGDVTLSITGNDWNIAETNGGLTPNIIGKGFWAAGASVDGLVIMSLDNVQKEVNFERVRGFDVLNMNNGSLQSAFEYQLVDAGFTTIKVDNSSNLTVKAAKGEAAPLIMASMIVGETEASTLATSARYGNDITVNSGSSLYAGNRVGNYIETGLISLEGGTSSLNLSDGSIVGFTIGGVSEYNTSTGKIITGGAQIATFTNQGQDNTYSHLFTENGINFEGATNVTLSILFDRSVFVGEIGTVLELGYDLISFGEGYTLTEDILGKFEFSIALNGGGAFHPNSGVGDLQAMYYDADGVSTTNFAEARGVRLAVTAYVPEPTTATLGILGLAGLLLRRRRK